MNNTIKEVAAESGFDAELMQRNSDNGTPSLAEEFGINLIKKAIANLKESYDNEYGLSEAIQRLQNHFGIEGE